jgi:hypothetical protein
MDMVAEATTTFNSRTGSIEKGGFLAEGKR